MAVLLKNRNVEPMSLPYPLKGVLKPGQGIVLNTTKAVVEAAIGPQNPSYLLIQDVVQTGNYDDDPYIGTLLTGFQSEDIGDGEIGAADLASNSVTAGKIAAGAVTGPKLATGMFKTALVAGVDEGSTPSIAVTGMAAGDELVEVLVFNPTDPSAFTQRALADFTVGAGALAVVDNAVDNTGNQYHIRYIDKT